MTDTSHKRSWSGGRDPRDDPAPFPQPDDLDAFWMGAHEALWVETMNSLQGAPNLVDIRILGLTAAIELAPRPGASGARAYAAVEHAFFKLDAVSRQARDPIVPTPSLIAGEADIVQLAEIVRRPANTANSRYHSFICARDNICAAIPSVFSKVSIQ